MNCKYKDVCDIYTQTCDDSFDFCGLYLRREEFKAEQEELRRFELEEINEGDCRLSKIINGGI